MQARLTSGCSNGQKFAEKWYVCPFSKYVLRIIKCQGKNINFIVEKSCRPHHLNQMIKVKSPVISHVDSMCAVWTNCLVDFYSWGSKKGKALLWPSCKKCITSENALALPLCSNDSFIGYAKVGHLFPSKF